ncbi:uncharacterized protein LOC113322319 [Papaver somniferum]|uniref:uncharacterized protein LOC113322319 n=1 Tax=Papaver somniferum TaxID=3469 RepID=UPI000E6F768E|nr:uncharacterized protein LOC113322319 [Papaver somniferum]
MKDEYTALRDNDTWDYVAPEPHMNVLGSKWVYKVKQKVDGTIDRLKSRLVAKGYDQQDGIYFNETFSPVVKCTTVRVVLCMAITYNWQIRQLDVSNAFLHGFLDKDIYMSQPQGFINPYYPSNYKSVSDNSMFVCTSKDGMLVLLLYVDDILLTGSSSILMNDLIISLRKEFAMKELEELGYFLGLEAVRNPTSITLTQNKYTLELLDKAKLLDSKPCDTPVVKGARLSIHDGVKLDNVTDYRAIVGGLQYLTMKRPDICFVVNYVSQFMHFPSDLHLQLVKRILRYLKGTIGLGITLTKGSLCALKAFTDSDWDGCPDTRRSTSGFAVFLGPNLVSWSSKKQPTISKSSAEAEYKCLSVASAELKWISYILADLHVKLDSPALLLCENISALATNPVFQARTKHIEIQYHTVRELVDEGFLELHHITSENQIAYLFIKGL